MNVLTLTTIFYFVFAALTQIGGAIGFIKAKSKASLIAGLLAGGLLELAGLLLVVRSTNSRLGLGLGIVVSLLLLGRFGPAFLRSRKIMPAGMMLLLSLISLGLSAAAWFAI